MSPHDDGINGNPVGDLQEMCMKRRLPLPVYEVGLEKGAPHERCFIIVCAVGGNLKESGSGKSKKLAKRQAAHKMLNTLKSMPVERDNEQSFAMIDEDVQHLLHSKHAHIFCSFWGRQLMITATLIIVVGPYFI